MAVLKLSQITPSAPGATTDQIVGVKSGTTDALYSVEQILDVFGATQGDILYRGASNWTVLAPGTSGNFLKTQGAAANPTWAAVSASAGGSDTQVQYNSTGSLAGDASFTYAGNGIVIIGSAGFSGSVALVDSGGNAVTITPTNATGAWTFSLPVGAGTNTYVLTTDGSGNTSWTAPGSTANLVVGTSTITSGTSGHVVYDNAGVVGEASQFTISSGQPNVTSGHSYLYNTLAIVSADTTNDNFWFGNSGNGASVSGTTNVGIARVALNALTTGSFNVAIGLGALFTATSDVNNIAIGYLALRNLIGSNGNNVAVGFTAMNFATTADNNVAIGSGAMGVGVVTGNNNVAMGTGALSVLTAGTNNFGLGAGSLGSTTTGGANVGVGAASLGSNVGGGGNVGIGANALGASTGDTNNVAVGASALSSMNGGSENIAIGHNAGQNVTTGSNNTILGRSEQTISSGSQNIAIGFGCGVASGSASGQLVIGNYIYGTGLTGVTSTISTGKIGIGIKAPTANLHVSGTFALTDPGGNAVTITPTSATGAWTFSLPTGAGTNTYVLTTDGSGNTSWSAPGSTANLVVGTSTITGGTTGHVVYDNGGVVGEASQFTISSGQPNVLSGHDYLYNGVAILSADTANTNLWVGNSGNFSVTGTQNTAVGLGTPAAALTSGVGNVAIGWNALKTATADSNCVAIGMGAMSIVNNNTGNSIAIGTSAMGNTVGANTDIAIGNLALNVDQGGDNVAIGASAMAACISGSTNFALGSSALSSLTNASDNIAIGVGALGNGNPSQCVGIGRIALVSTSGQNNVGIGHRAGLSVSTGNTNTILGALEATITSGSNNISIGASCGVASATASDQLVIGNYIYGTGLSGTGSTISTGKIGIGIKAPAFNLDVAGSIGQADAAALIHTTGALNDGAGTGIGVTFTNAPGSSATTGNPTKWIPIDDNGTTRYIPAF